MRHVGILEKRDPDRERGSVKVLWQSKAGIFEKHQAIQLWYLMNDDNTMMSAYSRLGT